MISNVAPFGASFDQSQISVLTRITTLSGSCSPKSQTLGRQIRVARCRVCGEYSSLTVKWHWRAHKLPPRHIPCRACRPQQP